MASSGVTSFSTFPTGWDLVTSMAVSAEITSDIAAGAIFCVVIETLDFE